MEEQLSGPDREAALQLVRETARPADELAAVLRARDFGRLRDMLRNRPASDLASMLTDLPTDDQVLVFRILPRREAAATFEYLSTDAQNALLKAMASEDVAALLNEMAPDDRTMFLEELPAEVTRQLLALLTPEERAVAVKLLGYPEGSIGRLMTPHYVAVREDWTVAQVLDYIRAHGQDSETLNVIYVVDDNGALIDDVRIREFLLTSPTSLVRDLMDRRFVALKATDDQETAVSVFRADDRSALPVTDSAGILIGIITVDDVLDVAEAEATEDIQRFGGTEALDEPYMEIGFARMIQKRAGWLTALFLGEMLTATAMGAYEHEIERAVVLALFVPLIISSGGNSGSQASTLVIRALALGEVRLAGLVAGDPPRIRGRPRARRHPRDRRLPADHAVVGVLRHVRHPLAAGRADRGHRADRGRAVGNADRIAAAVRAAASGVRSGGLVRPVRGDDCRRHGAGDLLLGRGVVAARHVALATKRTSLSCLSWPGLACFRAYEAM